eukprot:493474_1
MTAKQFTFSNVSEFTVPIEDDNSNFVCDLYVKPHYSLVGFTKIKSFISSKYTFCKLNNPTRINRTINVSKFDKIYNTGGVIQISSNSTIIISKTGEINANECGQSEHKDCSNGGEIQLISLSGDIINEGLLTSVGTNTKYSSGRVLIITNGSFINSGKIISSNVVIKCKNY